MPTNNQPLIQAPAAYVPAHALSFGGLNDAATFVAVDAPLPTRARLIAASSVPLAGTTSASGEFGPFVPELGRAIWVTLSGDWTGTAALLRSTDGGTTWLPLTVGGQPWASYSGNAQEAAAEESDAAASYSLSVALVSGTLTYRVAQ